MKKKSIILVVLVILLIISISNISSGAKEPTYRALLIGNSTYWDGNSLAGPVNDLIKMEESLGNNYFGKENKAFTRIVKKSNLTKSEMINSIRVQLGDVKEGDITYLYYSGHGSFDPYTNTSYLVGVDGLGLSVHELEKELRDVPGKIIIILDSCNSGGFINKSKGSISGASNKEDVTLSRDYTEEYNDSVVDIFSKRRMRSFLIGNKYKVITAASMYEYSYEIGYTDGWGWGGEFTRAFVTGSGYNNSFLADSNKDDVVTLNEIYNFTNKIVKESNVQVYPSGDTSVIGSKMSYNISEEDTLWDEQYDIPVDKLWEVKFNLDLDESSWKEKIYMLDSDKKIFPTSLTKSPDEKRVIIAPKKPYNYNDKYTIVIEDNILSKNGARHKEQILVRFFTEKEVINKEALSMNIVQNGYFHSYPSASVRDAFENFFNYSTWEYFYSTDGSHVVEFNGQALKEGIPGNITLQFIVDLEAESFNVEYAAFENMPISNYELQELLESVYGYYANPKSSRDIYDIFNENKRDNILGGKKKR